MPDTDPKLTRFARVPFDVLVRLDQVRLRIGDILELKVGSVLTLEKKAGQNLDVLVGGSRLGSGEMVVVDNTMAVRLTSLEPR
jgi:flagellar motor switch protein FliN